jgi:hypothetical protein
MTNINFIQELSNAIMSILNRYSMDSNQQTVTTSEESEISVAVDTSEVGISYGDSNDVTATTDEAMIVDEDMQDLGSIEMDDLSGSEVKSDAYESGAESYTETYYYDSEEGYEETDSNIEGYYYDSEDSCDEYEYSYSYFESSYEDTTESEEYFSDDDLVGRVIQCTCWIE